MKTFANTKISVTTKTTGPTHDPYGSTILTVTRHGVENVYTCCGLRGFKYERKTPGRPINVVHDWDQENNGDLDIKFKYFTGATPDQWEHWYYERIHKEDPMDAYIGSWM